MPDLRGSLGAAPSLRVRHSLDDRGSALTVEDLTVVHGLHRFSVPTLVALERESSFGLGSSAGLGSTARSSARSSLAGASGRAAAEGHSSPDHELASTRVRFLGVTRHAGAGGRFCEFLVQVDTGKEQFVVRKRFSEFRDLRQTLLAALRAVDRCRGGACAQLEGVLAQAKFPRRKLSLLRRGSSADLDTARDRVLALQSFVETLLRVYRHAPRRQVRCCLNSDCHLLDAVRTFLELSGPLALADSGAAFAHADSVFDDAQSARDVDWRERPSSPGEKSPPTGRRSPPRDKLASSTLSTASTLSSSSSRASVKFNESQSGEVLYTITEDLESLHVRA